MSFLAFHLGAQVQVWQLGVDNDPSENPYRPMGEFSPENHANDPSPGKVTRIPGDPLYDAANVAPPDDDFYFAGTYPVGFNELTEVLSVPYPEPTTAWERAHTRGDQTNRIHFILTSAQAAAAKLRLTVEFPVGGDTVNGVVQPGIGTHDMVIRWRNGSGAATVIYSGQISSPTLLVIEKAVSEIAATEGPNTIEVVRTGPSIAGTSPWLGYDFVRLEAIPSNSPPVLTTPPDVSVDELSTLSFFLQATDPDVPGQTLTYSLVSGPSGLGVSTAGLLTWTPTEAQGPGVYTVSVRVTDSGTPALSDTRQFTVTVNEVPDPPARTVWQIGTDNLPTEVPYLPHAEFSTENGRNDAPPGVVTRLPG
ncbi:MAG: putative Ig domain-containing protein, partial [Verrucomicrobiae bacterium]|nr:putative Ig domain-containing protein [Verrucomicrobiae bacterium]